MHTYTKRPMHALTIMGLALGRLGMVTVDAGDVGVLVGDRTSKVLCE